MTTPLCARCPRPTPDGYVCTPCADTLAHDLRTAADRAPELDVTVAKLARIDHAGAGPRGDITPDDDPPPGRPGVNLLDRSAPRSALAPRAEPLNWLAAEVARDTTNVFTTWARVVEEERGRTCSGHPAAWLAGHTEWLRHHPAAAEAFDELAKACRDLTHAIDRPAERVFAGRCACGGYLYGPAGHSHITCRSCGTAYDTKAMRTVMLDQLDQMLMTAAQIAVLAGYFGVEHNRTRVRNLITKWHGRGLIDAYRQDDNVVYPFGDTMRRIATAELRSTG